MFALPEVSIILPYFNAERTIGNAIQSVLNQTFINFELLCVNNNSTDKSSEIVRKFAKKDKRIKQLSEYKQGVAYASEAALQVAKAPFVARMDADDICKPARIEKQLNFLKQHSDIDVVGSMVEYAGSADNKGIQLYIDKTNKRITHKEISLFQFSELQVINPTLFFRKKIAIEYGFYRHGNFPEDYEMFLRWLHNGVKFYKLPEKLLIWHDSENRLTRTDLRYSTQAFYETKSPYIAEYSKQHNPYHPEVVVWGGGRKSMQRAKILMKYGLKIKFYIDIKKNKPNTKHFETIQKPDNFFILSYVANRGADQIIENYLEQRGFKNGKDFLIVA